MKKIILFPLLILTALALCGFVSGIEFEKQEELPPRPSGPVLSYDDADYVPLSKHESYRRAHVLAVSSLDEALSLVEADPFRARHMACGAYRYMKLLRDMVRGSIRESFSAVTDDLKNGVDDFNDTGITRSAAGKMRDALKKAKNALKKAYTYEQVKSWIIK